MYSVCNLTYAQLEQTFGRSRYMFSVCGLGSYMVLILSEAYGFSETQTHITFRNQDALGNSFSWALGAMMFEENLLPWTITRTETVLRTTEIVLAVLLVVCVLALAASHVHYRSLLAPTPESIALLPDSTSSSSVYVAVNQV
jgi:hypothetical protein